MGGTAVAKERVAEGAEVDDDERSDPFASRTRMPLEGSMMGNVNR